MGPQKFLTVYLVDRISSIEIDGMKPIKLSVSQMRRIAKVLRDPHDAEAFRRALVLRNLHFGISVAALAEQLAVSRADIYYLANSFFRLGDLEHFLKRQPVSGRPSIWTSLVRKRFEAALTRKPEKFGYFARGWTAGLLRDHLERRYGLKVSEETIRRELHALDYVSKRPWYCLAPDPGGRSKKNATSYASDSPAPAGQLP